MSDDRVDFASMLASRLCHDLLSPVGAFANGLELLADEKDPDMRARCIELLEQSARTSANKLKFFRLAFGSAGGFGELVPADEAKSAIQGIIGDRAIELNWMIGSDPLPKPAVKIILNLALLLVDALVRGGRLDIGAESNGDGTELAIRAEGPKVLLDQTLRETLINGEPANGQVEPRAAGAWLAHALAQEGGGTIQLSDPSTELLVIGAALPAQG